MIKHIAVFGGSGYIGSQMIRTWLSSGEIQSATIFDIQEPPPDLLRNQAVMYIKCDVREEIPDSCPKGNIDWIFNFAAVHREPGHEAEEYFDTNLKGAINVTNYARKVGCENILFTSSISVYGPTSGPTDESSTICPITPYGGSKFPAELLHKIWQSESPNRKLVVVRPGVVYGPKDPGNIGRMVQAIKKGYFMFPGSTSIRKSYAYVYGLIDSFIFTMNDECKSITYNYVETPTETLGDIAHHVKEKLSSSMPILSAPQWLLIPIASVAQLILGRHNPIHPTRVKKAGLETHIVPGKLISMGFNFKYSFRSSLDHWEKSSPNDFKR